MIKYMRPKDLSREASWYSQWSPVLGNPDLVLAIAKKIGLPDVPESSNPDAPTVDHGPAWEIDWDGTIRAGRKVEIWEPSGMPGTGRYAERVIPSLEIGPGDWWQEGSKVISNNDLFDEYEEVQP